MDGSTSSTRVRPGYHHHDLRLCDRRAHRGQTGTASRDDLLTWVRRAGDAVCTYYGKFPVPHVSLDLHVRGGSGVHGGVTYPDNGGYITISLGADTTVAQLNDDW